MSSSCGCDPDVPRSVVVAAASGRRRAMTTVRDVARVVAERGEGVDPLEGLARIGIDEISHRRGHNYLTVVVDHDSGRLVWAKAGRNKKTMEAFFDDLGDQRCAEIRLVSADAADWIGDVVADRCT